MNFNSTENLKARLRRHGLRPTRQRVRLANLLLDGQNRHVRPDDIYEQLKSGPAKLSRGTVYNTCLLYTSPSPRDLSTSRMPSSA